MFSYGYVGPPTSRDLAGFGGLWKSIRKTVSSFDPTKKGGIGNTLKAAGALIAAPLVVPTTLAVKGTTWVGAQTGVKPLVKLDSAVGTVYRSPLVTQLRDSYATQLVVGAAVGTAIVAAPFVGAAVSSVGGTLGAAGTSILAAQGKTPAKPAAVPPTTAVPGGSAPGGIGALGPIAGGGAGFLAAGPLGALVGATAGYFLGRK